MSVLDINEDSIDLGVIKHKLIKYMDCYSYYNHILKDNDITLSSEIDIYESDAKNLIFYYVKGHPNNIYIIKERLVYRREWSLIFAPLSRYPDLRLLTLNDIINF